MEDAVRLGAATELAPSARRRSARQLAPAHLWLLAIASLVLCACDAMFTLALIESNHFYEANPLMESLMRIDTSLFVAAKMSVTAVSLVVLIRFWDRTLFGRMRVAWLLHATFGMYAVLVGYEVAMLAVVV